MRRSTDLFGPLLQISNRPLRRLAVGAVFAFIAAVLSASAHGIAQEKDESTEPAAADSEPAKTDESPAMTEEPAGDAEQPAEEMTPGGDQPVPEPEEVPLEDVEAEKRSPELPPDYKPPGNRPKEMTISKPLMTEEEEKSLFNELRTAQYKNFLRNGRMEGDAAELFKKIARYHVYRLTIQQHLDNRELHEIRDQLSTDIKIAGLLQSTPSQKNAFRTAFLQEIVDRAAELLDGNFYVRLNAALILAHLDLAEEELGKPAVPFAPSIVPLMKIIKAEDQHQAVKIVALTGIHRLSVAGALSQTDRLELADALIAELKNPKYHPWYQMRLVETLGRLDLALDRNLRPMIIQSLTEVLADRSRHWVVRSEAAKSLGRCKISKDINLKKVVWEIVQLARDMMEGYNKQREAFYWKLCFYNLYLAFKPQDAEERNLKFGLLQNDGQYKQLIQNAYDLVYPLTKHILGADVAESFPDENIKNFDGWLKQNMPESQSIAPNMPAITSPQARVE